MRKAIVLILCLMATQAVSAQSINEDFVTIYLTRHAEKKIEATPDPELTEDGLKRADRLAWIMKDLKVQIIYSTNFKRTQKTVEPLAKQNKIPVMFYEVLDMGKLSVELKKQFGQTIVISGHSNTIPDFVNHLIGENRFGNIDDNDYTNLFLVKIHRSGSVSVEVLKY